MVKHISVVTTGGDCPGLNAAIRAVVRTSVYHGIKVTGVMHGYDGLIKGEFIPLTTESVGNILQRGGTILKTARSEAFRTDEGKKSAFQNLKLERIEAIIVIGGDGSLHGAHDFILKHDFPVMGIPKTIDNDVYGTDVAIGFDSAVNTVIHAVDNIRDTALTHYAGISNHGASFWSH